MDSPVGPAHGVVGSGVAVNAAGSPAIWATGASLLPAKDVTIVPVLVSRAEVQNEGTPLFQAAGWVEPRPTPTLVSAQAEGVIEKLLVVEGQEVVADQPVAQLIDTDARMAVSKAEAEVQLREADLDTALDAILDTLRGD